MTTSARRATPFIHHEPFRYMVVGSEPVLNGTLADLALTSAATAWGTDRPGATIVHTVGR